MGYSLDGQNNVSILGNRTIPFLSNGLHHITLNVNDTLGTVFTTPRRYFIVGSSNPEVSIISPTINQYFGNSAPNFTTTTQGVNLDKIWYSVDNGITNITIYTSTAMINQTEWDKIPHGLVSLNLYINDTFGRLGYFTVNFNKDLNAPTTSIHYTLLNSPNQVITSTQFTFTANDNSESGVSTTQYKINDSAWIPYTGAFTLASYDSGFYTITYQSVDAVGNIEIEKNVVIELYIPPPPPPPPPDISFLIYIIIGVAATLFGFIYLKVIRPKTAPKREIKKNEKAEQVRLKRKYIEQQRAESDKLRQRRLEHQRFEREELIREQKERERLERERLEQIKKMRESERQKKIEFEKQKRLDEEKAIIEKIRIVMDVSTRVKIELLRNYLKMDEKLFNDKIFVWAKQFGFIIDGDYLNIRKENVSDFIDELEKQFQGWRKSEGDHSDKI